MALIVEVTGKSYYFGWIPTYKNNEDGNTWQWGGDLAFPLKLIHAKTIRFVRNLRLMLTRFALIKHMILHAINMIMLKAVAGICQIKDLRMKKRSYGEVCGGNHNYFEMNMDVTFGKDNRGFGVSFRTGNHGFNGYEIFIDP